MDKASTLTCIHRCSSHASLSCQSRMVPTDLAEEAKSSESAENSTFPIFYLSCSALRETDDELGAGQQVCIIIGGLVQKRVSALSALYRQLIVSSSPLLPPPRCGLPPPTLAQGEYARRNADTACLKNYSVIYHSVCSNVRSAGTGLVALLLQSLSSYNSKMHHGHITQNCFIDALQKVTTAACAVVSAPQMN